MKPEPRSCATCNETRCVRHGVVARVANSGERVAWLLDMVWPEIADLVSASFQPNDQLLAPGIAGSWPRSYAWPVKRPHPAAMATLGRHLAMRSVAKAPGHVRQRAYLTHDRRIARRLARNIDFRCRHLVVAQTWLPWLDELGVFGGRTFDVVMSRYPLGAIHDLLDQAAKEIGPSATIVDFRAPPDIVAREADLLDRARCLYTPHYGIAGLFPGRTMLLPWKAAVSGPTRGGDRVAFLGPTIARQRPDIARRLARGLDQPLIVFGAMIEDLWGDLPTERRSLGPDWLKGIGAILHPATVTHEPRALLVARANGVTIYATATCGLSPDDYRPIEQFKVVNGAP